VAHGSHSGMGSRIANHINFPDYSVEELIAIGRMMVESSLFTESE
jgi:hypothetical protein